MILPKNGRVVIVDDNIMEALPLIKVLSEKNVPSVYYSGNYKELHSLEGTRVVFLDLQLLPNLDAKTTVSNAISILKKIIGEKNGPYLLIIWSAHNNDYKEELIMHLSTTPFRPEFILDLEKSDFFMDSEERIKTIVDTVDGILEADIVDAERRKNCCISIIEGLIEKNIISNKIGEVNALNRIEEKLVEELKKVNMIQLLILWETTINNSARSTVNKIYNEMPTHIAKDKLLQEILYYLAHYKLEKQMSEVDDDIKFKAAISTLNEMFYYFYTEDTMNISKNDLASDKEVQIIKNSNLEESISRSKFNNWVITTPPRNGLFPGNVYKDKEKIFEPYKLISGKNAEDERKNFIKEEELIFILLDISADCDFAQKKQQVAKIVPGILCPLEIFKVYLDKKAISEGNYSDFICCLGEIELSIDGKICEYKMLFNLNLMTFININEMKSEPCLFSLRKPYLAHIQVELGNLISRQGIAKF